MNITKSKPIKQPTTIYKTVKHPSHPDTRKLTIVTKMAVEKNNPYSYQPSPKLSTPLWRWYLAKWWQDDIVGSLVCRWVRSNPTHCSCFCIFLPGDRSYKAKTYPHITDNKLAYSNIIGSEWFLSHICPSHWRCPLPRTKWQPLTCRTIQSGQKGKGSALMRRWSQW